MGTSGHFAIFLDKLFYDNIQLDKPDETFKYTKDIKEVQNTYQKVYGESLPRNMSDVKDETTRILVEYQKKMGDVKKVYNTEIETYAPFVNMHSSDKAGGELYNQALSVVRANITTNSSDSQGQEGFRMLRYSDVDGAGELVKEKVSIGYLNKIIQDRHNADNPPKDGQAPKTFTIEDYFNMADKSSFQDIRFFFDGYNPDPKKPINVMLRIPVLINGSPMLQDFEMSLEGMSPELISKMGIPVDKSATKSLDDSKGISFTLPPITGNVNHDNPDLKNGVKYFVVPNIKGVM
jgi:hypothetical protein